MPVYLSALGIACSVGQGKQEVAKAIFKQSSFPFETTRLLLSQKVVPVGRVPFELPELSSEFIIFNSRNNKLLKLALDEIKPAIEEAITKYGADRVGVVMSTSTSGMHEKEQASLHKHRTGHELDGYHYSQSEISSPSLFVSKYLGIKGPAYTISTACSSSAKAICSASRLITAGICDAVVVGGVDTLCDLTLNGFDSLELMSKKVCNPFSKNRDGITIGEGAAVFLVSKEGNVEAGDIELGGYGESSDAHHISCPEPNGLGAEVAIYEALAKASLKPEEICYINLHGTGTTLNDSMESICVHRIFGSEVPCSSTKGLTGHTLGASGAIEAAFLWLALTHEANGTIPLPAHVWDGEADLSVPTIHLIGYEKFSAPINGAYALMSNSFAFGGSNVSIILKKHAQVNNPIKIPITEFIPHEPPMVLIDRVVTYEEDFIHCQVTICNNSLFCENGSVPSYVAIEYMAQAIAAWNGIMAQKVGEKPRIGFLLGSRRLELKVPSFIVGEILDVYGKAQYTDGEMASFDCWVEIHGTRVVHAGLNVYQPKEGEFNGK